jgi:tRNA pseudouridine55 synthase
VVDGFVLVDKPKGWTSHDVVGKLRRLFSMKRIGHAGTLDPMATGLLVVGLGKATRLLRFIQELPKEYVAEVRFGVATDTGDAEGSVIEEVGVDFEVGALRDVVADFVGELEQVPPQVSAIKVGGQRLHRLARQGVTVVVEPRSVVVHELEVTGVALPRATMRVRCGKGTYIRVLADDIAKSLGSRAHLTGLRRTASGSLLAADAVTVDELERADDRSQLVLSPALGLRDLVAVAVPPNQRRAARHGAPVHGVEAVGDRVVALDDGELVGVYRPEGDILVPEVVLT